MNCMKIWSSNEMPSVNNNMKVTTQMAITVSKPPSSHFKLSELNESHVSKLFFDHEGDLVLLTVDCMGTMALTYLTSEKPGRHVLASQLANYCWPLTLAHDDVSVTISNGIE